MKQLVFKTPGTLDLNTIRLMGVSVKEHDNSIGRFGTGLKYAIAVILRHGGRVKIQIDDMFYCFCTDTIQIRGKEFERIILQASKWDHCGEVHQESLGFTTELGKHWEPWMAVRELYSNTLDERGEVVLTSDVVVAEPNQTCIIVEGDDFIKVWQNRKDYFISSEEAPLSENSFFQAFAGTDDNSIFYQGINVGETEYKTFFKYNICSEIDLTEDRTIKYDFQYKDAIEMGIIVSDDYEFINTILTTGYDYLEVRLPFTRRHNNITESEAFIEVMKSFEKHFPKDGNREALAWHRRRNNKTEAYEEISLNSIQQSQLDRAIQCIGRLGFAEELALYPIHIVTTLGDSVHGRAKDNKIYLSKDCFREGTKHVFSVLFEEFVHCHYGYVDQTRSLQTFLFNQITTLTETYVMGEAI